MKGRHHIEQVNIFFQKYHVGYKFGIKLFQNMNVSHKWKLSVSLKSNYRCNGAFNIFFFFYRG